MEEEEIKGLYWPFLKGSFAQNKGTKHKYQFQALCFSWVSLSHRAYETLMYLLKMR